MATRRDLRLFSIVKTGPYISKRICLGTNTPITKRTVAYIGNVRHIRLQVHDRNETPHH